MIEQKTDFHRNGKCNQMSLGIDCETHSVLDNWAIICELWKQKPMNEQEEEKKAFSEQLSLTQASNRYYFKIPAMFYFFVIVCFKSLRRWCLVSNWNGLFLIYLFFSPTDSKFIQIHLKICIWMTHPAVGINKMSIFLCVQISMARENEKKKKEKTKEKPWQKKIAKCSIFSAELAFVE